MNADEIRLVDSCFENVLDENADLVTDPFKEFFFKEQTNKICS